MNMHISPDTNPVNPTRLSTSPTKPHANKVQADPLSASNQSDVFRKGLLADLTHELKKNSRNP